MKIGIRLLALAAMASLIAAAPAPDPAPDWRFVALTNFRADHWAAVYIDAASIRRTDGRATYTGMTVLDRAMLQADNIIGAIDADCTTHAYRSLDTRAFRGSELVAEIDVEPNSQARPNTTVYHAIDMACGNVPLDDESIADPLTDGARRTAEQGSRTGN